MSYKRNNASNRDALFGNKNSKNQNSSNRDALFSKPPSKKPTHASNPGKPTTAPGASSLSSKTVSSQSKASKSSTIGSLSGSVKLKKMKEAEEYREKAKKAMTRGMFSRPDPVIGGTYYRRAAELYKQCGENRLERLHRVASADCQRGQDAFSSAAMEYTRAAQLAMESDEKDDRKRSESFQLFKSAAEAWTSLGEKSKLGQSWMNAACALLIGQEDEDKMNQNALKHFEDAIERHVPDPLNRFAFMRQTGCSLYEGENEKNKMRMALDNIIDSPYAYETCNIAVRKLTEFHEFKSALYAAGAVSALFEREGIATLSLSRSYLSETILQLAIGDIVAADQTFVQVHLQKDTYLSSRECKLAEDLIRAIKTMDWEALDNSKLENRSALANLDPFMRALVLDLKVSGSVRKKKVQVENKSSAPPVPNTKLHSVADATDASHSTPHAPAPPQNSEGEQSSNDLEKEMDDLMGDMGLNDGSEEDDDNDFQDHDEEEDDDDFDLR